MAWIQSAQHLGGRIRKWRERMDLNLEEVVSLSGVSTDTWTGVESGERYPSSFQLSRMAYALGAEPADLLSSEAALSNVGRGVARFRSEPSLDSLTGQDRRRMALGAMLSRTGGELFRLLGQTPRRLPSRGTPVEEPPWQQGYRLGEEARALLDVPEGPIPSMIDLLQGHGVHVAFVEFDSTDIHAASIAEPASMPVILVNRRSPRAQRDPSLRAVLAHELCHLLFDIDENNLVTLVTRASAYDEAVEQRANGFAPSFLAPGSQIAELDLSNHDLMRHLMEVWGFSQEGARWHVKNVRRLPRSEDELLEQQRVRIRLCERRLLHEVLDSPDEALPAEPSDLARGLLSRLVAEALEAELVSEGRAREIVEMS